MKWLKKILQEKKYSYQREQISNLFGYIRVALYKSTFKSRSRLQSRTIVCSLLHRALHAASAVFSHQHVELEQHTHSGGSWRYVAAPELDQISRLFSAAATVCFKVYILQLLEEGLSLCYGHPVFHIMCRGT